MNDISRSKDDRRNDEESKRENGMPGGGKGRRDEVGRSGVYPMSGPHPAGNAELKEQAAWGQGERGAAGYEDHGGSELTLDSGQLLGGLNVGPGGEPQRQPPQTEAERDVPHEEWREFLDSFSRQHLDWLVTVELVTGTGRLVAIEERPLQGISFDRADDKERAYIQVGGTPDEHFTHIVDTPTSLRFEQTQTGAHEGVEITSADGTITVVRFRSAMRPEALDGIAA